MLSSAVTEVEAALGLAGIAAELRTFPEPVRTAAAAANALGCAVGAIANSLVFETAGRARLVLASGAHRVDTAKVAQRLGTARIRRAAPEFVFEQPGSTSAASRRSGIPGRCRP
jgi:prolyl-tRNA editing enzyme YbaK/EbsC (Cys-tRNA(Pro) deacylase)